MRKEPALILGAIATMLSGLAVWLTNVDEIVVLVIPLLEAIAIRARVYAPATVDSLTDD